MFALVSFSAKAPAQILTDYLLTQDIAVQLVKHADLPAQLLTPDTEPEGFLVIVTNYDDLAIAKKIAEDFCQNPQQDKYRSASWQLSKSDQSSQTWSPAQAFAVLGRLKPLTFFILLAIVVLHLSLLLGGANILVPLLSFPADLSELALSQFYRVWTPALLHGDWVHLAFNGFWWVWLANRIEAKEGSAKLFNLSLVTGTAAHLAQYIAVGANFVGLSGVVYGLFAYVWLLGFKGKQADYYIPNNLIGFLVVWMLIGFADMLWLSMANWAHLAGFLTGLAWAGWQIKLSK